VGAAFLTGFSCPLNEATYETLINPMELTYFPDSFGLMITGRSRELVDTQRLSPGASLSWKLSNVSFES